MAPSKKNITSNAAGWASQDAGYESTTSPTIIKSLLDTLKKEHAFISLYSEDYKSFGSLLVDIKDSALIIDKPKDWVGVYRKLRVSFKNRSKVAHHFYAHVTTSTRNTIHLNFPREVYRLQRRSYFRVDLPRGSYATFMYNGKKCKFNVKDISVGGMLFYTKNGDDISEHVTKLESIKIKTPLLGGENIKLNIRKGEIVRTTYNKRHKVFFHGVHYFPTSTEEEQIMKFVRKRELQILRKGVSEN